MGCLFASWLQGGEHIPKLRFILRPAEGGDCPLRSKSQGSAKVVAATQREQVAAIFPAIHYYAWSGSAGAPFWNMLTSVAEAI
ncbi:MAG TPA: hypothetical protein VE710_05150 [Candidatus Bathyarchaeia archaeon]|nr:hypothetical protein [Candidatus Bathyarchaeia archaeon]